MELPKPNHGLRALLLLLAAAGGCGSHGDDLLPAQDAAVEQTLAFNNLRIEEVSARRAVVRFDTSRPTRCEAEWGFSSGSIENVATDPNMDPGTLLLQHEVPLEDLPPNATVYLRARATDAANNTYYSDVIHFQTLDGEAGPGGTNVAQISMGAFIAQVSSNFGGAGNAEAWGANQAIDGAMGTEWSSWGNGDDAWLEIHLGRERTLKRFAFRSRKMTDGTSIISSVRLVLDGRPTEAFSTPDPDIRYEFTLPTTTARSVRVEAVTTTGGNTGIKEVELFEE